MSHSVEYALKFTFFIFLGWKLFTWRPKWNDFRPGKKSLFLRGYEIPNPHVSVLLACAAIAAVPAAVLIFAHRPISASCAVLFGVGFFHLRNHVVRTENERGWHDPVWGAHLSRRRQAEFEQRMPTVIRWATVGIRKLMYRDDQE